MKRLGAAVLAVALTGGACAAQTAGGEPPSGVNVPPPPAQSGTAAAGSFVANRSPGQELASELRGRDVYDARKTKIGSVNDLVIDPNGRVEAAVIGVGGFLGMGEKNVAAPFSDLKIGRDSDGQWLVLDRTRDQLKNAPAFDPKPAAP